MASRTQNKNNINNTTKKTQGKASFRLDDDGKERAVAQPREEKKVEDESGKKESFDNVGELLLVGL